MDCIRWHFSCRWHNVMRASFRRNDLALAVCEGRGSDCGIVNLFILRIPKAEGSDEAHRHSTTLSSAFSEVLTSEIEADFSSSMIESDRQQFSYDWPSYRYGSRLIVRNVVPAVLKTVEMHEPGREAPV